MDFFRGLDRYEGLLVEDSNVLNAAKVGSAASGPRNILDRNSARGLSLNQASRAIRDAKLPQHMHRNFRTVVCRHWLNGQCMKGATCEFLHQQKLSAMPECRDGMKCPNRLNGRCLLKHTAVDNNCHFFLQC